MIKTIYSRYDKERIASLPVVTFPGRIIVVNGEYEAERAARFLLTQPILGIDTETKPTFKRGQHTKVSLLQVSTPETCFLFRLNHIGMLPSIIRLLSDSSVPKVGLSLHDDINSLHRRADFEPGAFVDIQELVGQLGVKDMSLQKLYANLFGQKISKRQRLTNWNADVLTEAQKLYAATDAWACINLYNEIRRLKQTGDYQLICVEQSDSSEEKTTASDDFTLGYSPER